MSELTRKQIEQMEAGREMDALVANEIMGWDRITPKGIEIAIKHGMTGAFSTDIAAAWEVVEKIGVYTVWRGSNKQVTAAIGKYPGGEASADTAPLAICRAALLAVNI